MCACFHIQQCLRSPHKAQYNGGIVINPEFEDGLRGWSNFGGATELEGNRFLVAKGRNNSYASPSQKFILDKDMMYTFSGKSFSFLSLQI